MSALLVTGEELDAAMLDLRRRGVSYMSLAVVADYVYGWRLTSEQIRRRLRSHYGVLPDPTRQRFGAANPIANRVIG